MSTHDKETLIHDLVAERLIEVLQDSEATTPGWIQAALRFLQQNEVSGLDVPGSSINRVKEAVAEKAPFPRIAEGG